MKKKKKKTTWHKTNSLMFINKPLTAFEAKTFNQGSLSYQGRKVGQ
jgi:hypothetical protein